MIDFIQEYSQAGFAVFPISGKIPKAPGWEKTEVLPDLSADTFPPGNFGVVLGEEILVLDVDVRKGPGKESYGKLCYAAGLEHGWESDTFTVRTGSGGCHVYLRKPKDLKLRKNLVEFPFIDFLSGNMYVVGAGCVHPDTGQTYDPVFCSPKKIAPAPSSLLRLIERKEVVHARVESGFIDDSPENVLAYKRKLVAFPVTEEGGRDNACYRAACIGRDMGLTAESVANVLQLEFDGKKLVPALGTEAVDIIVGNVFRYAKNEAGVKNVGAIFGALAPVAKAEEETPLAYDRDKGGKPKPTMRNASNYIQELPGLKGIFKYDEFSYYIELDRKAPWQDQRGGGMQRVGDDDIILLKDYLIQTVQVEFSVHVLWEAVTVNAKKKIYHPVRDFLKGLKWDGTPRLETWLFDYCGTELNEYTRAVARKVLCAGVRRVMQPGCAWQFVLVLEGQQGIGKSTLCRILGGEWAGEMNLDPHAKDSVLRMMGKWIIELSEMAVLKFGDQQALKHFISCEKDTIRLPYDRASKDIKRQSIFIGTVNPDNGYLSDTTGNRRYWIVKVTRPVSLGGLRDVVEQLWAEAVEGYKDEDLFLIGRAEELQVIEAKARMPEEPLKVYVEKWMADNPMVNEVTASQVLTWGGMPVSRIGKGEISRVGGVFQNIGWVRVTGEGGDNVYSRPVGERYGEIDL